MRMTLARPVGSLGRGFLTAVLVALLACASPSLAQFGGGGGGQGGGGLGGGGGGGLGGGGGGGLGGGGGGGLGGGGGGGGLGGGGGQGGGGGGQGSGVIIDANGVLHRIDAADPGGRLAQQRIAEAMNRLEGDLAKPSKLRKVSLTRLEKALAGRLDAGQQPTDAMQKLAGLTRIDYVFCYPETNEIVLAGPAEPWAEAPSGRTLGIQSGKPTLELQDLVTAMRAFGPDSAADDAPLIYCSIDPTEEGLQRMQQFLARVGRPNPNLIASQLQERLGEQVITVGGVPADTHFAQVLVEADYRMKLIGIGLEQAAAPIASYVSRVNPATVSKNALQRWYFVPDYERIKTTEDGLAMEMVGEGVRLVGEDEVVSRDGMRRKLGRNNRASNKFVTEFTENYAKLAAASPVYAQLRNCIDLAVAAAFMKQHDLFAKSGWSMGVLADESKYPVRTQNAPQKVASAVNALWKGSTLMTPIGGGVMIRPTEALDAANVKADEDGKLAEQRATVEAAAASDAWWWD
ncbi:hypothetical protein Pla108_03490 [Botrimarina colliarenosi]|uniref:DUF1598 domain-containing protein n=1 Tax=Botrimarina colliarenosi TaxID=2528001 RepID=A0A5C6AHA2_9BACT|nr:DUF1598 domain-containing protein [Botrimarina colliarenosi]TWT99412.1 hypothetical protein Pla108_03490 [Botrimarina colliarenosi]